MSRQKEEQSITSSSRALEKQLNLLRELFHPGIFPKGVVEQIPLRYQNLYPAILGVNKYTSELVAFPLISDKPRSILVPDGQEGLPFIHMFLASIAGHKPTIYCVSPNNSEGLKISSGITTNNYAAYERGFWEKIVELCEIMEQRKSGRNLGTPYVLIARDLPNVHRVISSDSSIASYLSWLVSDARGGFAFLGLVPNPADPLQGCEGDTRRFLGITSQFYATLTPEVGQSRSEFQQQYYLQIKNGGSIPLVVPRS